MADRAKAKQKHFMLFDHKPLRRRFIHLQGAVGKIERAVAFPAMEVMMVTLSGSFIQRSERRMKNRYQPPAVDEHLEVPVNSCLIERIHGLLTVFKNFIHTQRSFMLTEDLFYGCSLRGVALQGLIFHALDYRISCFLLQVFSQ